MNWQKTTFSHIQALHTCALSNDFFANNYSAVNSVLYEQKFHSLIAIEGDWIYETYSAAGKTMDSPSVFGFPHNTKGDKRAVSDAVAKLVDNATHSGNNPHGGKSIVFANILSEEKDILLTLYPNARATATPESGDYLYRTEHLAGLAGKKYSRKRNHIHQFHNNYPDCTYEPLTKENCAAVRNIEESWLSENSDTGKTEAGNHDDLLVERNIIFCALEHFDAFANSCGMSGGVLFVSGQPVAFCIASLLSTNVTNVHFEKCISPFARNGGYAVINNEFAKNVKTEFINREEDLGIEGLRKAKLSYYPVQVLEKWTVSIPL